MPFYKSDTFKKNLSHMFNDESYMTKSELGVNSTCQIFTRF